MNMIVMVTQIGYKQDTSHVSSWILPGLAMQQELFETCQQIFIISFTQTTRVTIYWIPTQINLLSNTDLDTLVF